ncbi:hypothetical protein [Bdellovibrio sp. HCB337]|uniref:hypothetical protein n=1 Tax=Bdellovibrio sp. HCB337 TaxID=3394358 RepID=UPI0039A4B8B8
MKQFFLSHQWFLDDNHGSPFGWTYSCRSVVYVKSVITKWRQENMTIKNHHLLKTFASLGLCMFFFTAGCKEFELQDPSQRPSEDLTSEKLRSSRTRTSIRRPTVTPTATPIPTPTPKVVPTATPAVTATPASSPTVTIANPAIATIVASQTATSHEAKIPSIRYDWQKYPVIIMQSPSGADIPSWFEFSKPEWCYTLNSWLQVFEAEGNTAKNTRVQFRNLKIFVLSESTRKWSLVKSDVSPYTDSWQYPFAFSADGGTRVESSGGLSFKPKYPVFAHGYGTQTTIVPQDVRAVFVSMETKLVLENASGTDDRSSAKYLVNVGADYWPNAQAVNKTWSYAPGIGQGRFILATQDWRKATMIVPNGRYGSTMQEMIEKYPLPLDQ